MDIFRLLLKIDQLFFLLLNLHSIHELFENNLLSYRCSDQVVYSLMLKIYKRNQMYKFLTIYKKILNYQRIRNEYLFINL